MRAFALRSTFVTSFAVVVSIATGTSLAQADDSTTGNGVRLHVDSPVPVTVYSHVLGYGTTDNGHSFVLDTPATVCSSPCDKTITTSPDQELSVAGPHAVSSGSFRLDGLHGDQRLEVSPGSPPLRLTGTILLTAGGIALGVGLVLAVGGALSSYETPAQVSGSGTVIRPAERHDHDAMVTSGLIASSAGAAAIVGSIALIVASRTTLRLEPLSPTPKSTARAPRYWAGEF